MTKNLVALTLAAVMAVPAVRAEATTEEKLGAEIAKLVVEAKAAGYADADIAAAVEEATGAAYMSPKTKERVVCVAAGILIGVAGYWGLPKVYNAIFGEKKADDKDVNKKKEDKDKKDEDKKSPEVEAAEKTVAEAEARLGKARTKGAKKAAQDALDKAKAALEEAKKAKKA